MSPRTAQGHSTYWDRLVFLLPNQICDEVRLCRLHKTYKADVKRIKLNIVSPEKRLFVLVALGRTEEEPKYGRAPPTAIERELQTFLEDLLKDVKIMVKAFLGERRAGEQQGVAQRHSERAHTT